jgi:membrane carboxypeptidase/penicillin-binding protein
MGLAYKILLLFAALVLLAVAGVCGWFFVYTGDLPDIKYLSQFTPVAQSLVSDSCLAGPSTVIPFDRIGKPLQDALAAAEPHVSLSDQIARTLMCNRHERAGRYTLNTVRLSWHIRRRFSEQQLFTIYANRAYFGPGATGVEGASRQFFHKAPDTLSTEEAALIAGLLRAPNLLSPYKSPERALERRNKVLEGMVAQGKLSSDEAAKAEAAPLGVRPDLAEKSK